MPIRFRCPSGHLLSIGAEHAGKRLRCPKCLKIATVPSESPPTDVLPELLPADVPLREPVELSATTTARSTATLANAPPAPPVVTPPSIVARVVDSRPTTAPAPTGMPAVSVPPDRPASKSNQSPIERREAPANRAGGAAEKVVKSAAALPAALPPRQSAPKTIVPPGAASPAAVPPNPQDQSKRTDPVKTAQPTSPAKVILPPRATSAVPPKVVPPSPPGVPPLLDLPSVPTGPTSITPPPLPVDLPPLNGPPLPPPVTAPPVTAPPMAKLAVRNPFAEDPRELAPVQFEGELQKAVAEQTQHASRHALPTVIGYRPDRFKVQNVYLLAMGLLLLTLFNAAPAIKHWNLALAPDWARVVLFMTVVQVGFIVWMVLLPDWSTVWVSMLVFAGVATLYGVALAIAVMTPHGRPVALEMDDVRQNARLWCTAVTLLTCSMTYLCGRLSHQWYKGYQLGR